jgi:hypothetical protein
MSSDLDALAKLIADDWNGRTIDVAAIVDRLRASDDRNGIVIVDRDRAIRTLVRELFNESVEPAPRGAKCPRCAHPSKGHYGGTCLVKTGRNTRGPEGETVLHLCGCSCWQGPRPWLMEGPAWSLR